MLAVLFAFVLAPQDAKPAAPAAYDPLAVPSEKPGASIALEIDDNARARQIPLRVYLPVTNQPALPAPVVLWSHGLGGSRDNSAYLGEHWAARGYVAVFVQHHGSDDAVWRDAPLGERMSTLKQAASLKNYVLRCGDVVAVLDALTAWNGAADHALHGRLDLAHVGISGHSFGAVTTQAVGGQAVPLQGRKYFDPRIDAALAMSPSPPIAGDVGRAFAQVSIPWMLMTGTHDDSPIGDQTANDRLAVYPALPATIDRYELVLDGANHSVFAERVLPSAGERPNPNHHRAILALSTAFWDCELRSDAAARAWLHGDGARSVLDAKDHWQCAAAATAASKAPAARDR
jgi:predicted dienelactone hydrolase